MYFQKLIDSTVGRAGDCSSL